MKPLDTLKEKEINLLYSLKDKQNIAKFELTKLIKIAKKLEIPLNEYGCLCNEDERNKVYAELYSQINL